MYENILNCVQLFLKGTDRNHDVGTISSVVITGIVVVFIGLILLILFVSAYGKIFEAIEKRKAKKAKEKLENALAETTTVTPAPVAPPVVEDGIEEEIVAVIAAAVAAMGAKSGKKMVLKSVKTAKPSRPVWANAGIIENTRPF